MEKRIGLKLLRTKHDLNQAEMASRLGVDRTTYSLIENGKRKGSDKFWSNVMAEFNLTVPEMWDIRTNDSKEV